MTQAKLPLPVCTSVIECCVSESLALVLLLYCLKCFVAFPENSICIERYIDVYALDPLSHTMIKTTVPEPPVVYVQPTQAVNRCTLVGLIASP